MVRPPLHKQYETSNLFQLFNTSDDYQSHFDHFSPWTTKRNNRREQEHGLFLEQEFGHRDIYIGKTLMVTKTQHLGILLLWTRLSLSSSNAQIHLLGPRQLSQSLQTLSLTSLHPLHSTPSHTSVMDNLIIGIHPNSRIAKSLVTNPAVIFFSDDNPSTPSTFLLHMLRSKGELRRKTDLHDRLEGSDDSFFAYDGIGTANTAKEVRGQFAHVQVAGHQVQSVSSRESGPVLG